MSQPFAFGPRAALERWEDLNALVEKEVYRSGFEFNAPVLHTPRFAEETERGDSYGFIHAMDYQVRATGDRVLGYRIEEIDASPDTHRPHYRVLQGNRCVAVVEFLDAQSAAQSVTNDVRRLIAC